MARIHGLTNATAPVRNRLTSSAIIRIPACSRSRVGAAQEYADVWTAQAMNRKVASPITMAGRSQLGHARTRLVAAFSTLRDPRPVDVLIAPLDDADEEIVEQALLVLGQLRAARAHWSIARFLTHDDHQLWRVARRCGSGLTGHGSVEIGSRTRWLPPSTLACE